MLLIFPSPPCHEGLLVAFVSLSTHHNFTPLLLNFPASHRRRHRGSCSFSLSPLPASLSLAALRTWIGVAEGKMPGLLAPSDYSQEPPRHPSLVINAKVNQVIPLASLLSLIYYVRTGNIYMHAFDHFYRSWAISSIYSSFAAGLSPCATACSVFGFTVWISSFPYGASFYVNSWIPGTIMIFFFALYSTELVCFSCHFVRAKPNHVLD